MSLCLGKTVVDRLADDKTNFVFVEQSSAANEAKPPDEAPMVVTTSAPIEPLSLPIQKNVAKLLIANTLTSAVGGVAPVLQKVPNSNVITVVNASGPLTIIKTLCMTSGIGTAPQFTLVRHRVG